MNLTHSKKEQYIQKMYAELESIHITVLTLHVSPNVKPENFRRNPYFMLEFYHFFQKCKEIASCLPNYLEIKQNVNNINIIFTNITIKHIEEIFVVVKKLIEELASANDFFAAHELGCSLAAAIGIDCGSTYAKIYQKDNYLWLGDVIERAELLSQSANNDIYPDFIITYSIYQQLPPEIQNSFEKAYYINHIACYGTWLMTYVQAGNK